MRQIAVLGAGPSGMMAAHAVAQCGLEPVIYDRDPDQTRRNAGVFILHDRCDLILRSTVVRQEVLGAEDLRREGDWVAQVEARYREKVYGFWGPSQVSVRGALEQELQEVYNANEAVTQLWEMYGDCVQVREIRGIEDARSLDLPVISTIPAKALFPDRRYDWQRAYVYRGEAPTDEAFIYYSVGAAPRWYRCSAVFGVFTAEYGFARQDCVPVKKVMRVDEPLPSLDWLFLVGRYGAWDKGCLTHHVYERSLQEVLQRWV